jgi:hypothetical protein
MSLSNRGGRPANVPWPAARVPASAFVHRIRIAVHFGNPVPCRNQSSQYHFPPSFYSLKLPLPVVGDIAHVIAF